MKRPVLYRLIYPAGFGEVPISELSPSVYLPDRFFMLFLSPSSKYHHSTRWASPIFRTLSSSLTLRIML